MALKDKSFPARFLMGKLCQAKQSVFTSVNCKQLRGWEEQIGEIPPLVFISWSYADRRRLVLGESGSQDLRVSV